MSYCRTVAFVIFGLIHIMALSASAVPAFINYQGFLSDSLGVPLDTTIAMTFVLYADSAGSTPLWSESHPAVSIHGGIFAVMLGSITPFPQRLFDGSVRWFRMQIDGDPLTQPPLEIASVAYAFRSQFADTASFAIASAGSGAGGGWTDDGAMVRLTNPADQVGVGLNNPNRSLYILKQEEGLALPVKLDNPNSNIGTGIGILFSTGGNGAGQLDTSRGKGALVYEQRGDYWNRGKFHFLQSRYPTTGLPTLSDAVLTIESGGNVGIGTTTPARRLDVQGGMRLRGQEGNVADMGNGLDLAYDAFNQLGLIRTIVGASYGNLYLGQGKVGVNTMIPEEQLDVVGTVKTTGLKLTSAPTRGYVLTADSVGTATWQPASVSLPYSGTLATTAVGFSVTTSAASGTAMRGWNTSKDNRGILGGDTAGVYGTNGGYGIAVLGEAYGGKGIYGKHQSGNYGWLGGDSYGAYGAYAGAANFGGLGGSNYGVYGQSGSGFAGYFSGRGYFSNNVGIGTTNPSYRLHVYHSGGGFIISEAGNNELNGYVVREAGVSRWILFFRGWQSDNLIVRDEPALRDVMTFQSGTGRVGIGTSTPEEQLDVAGNVRCTIMKITGADVAEPFEVASDTELKPGMVVSIDPAGNGKLQVTSEPYDHRVAGVISGAGGIEPGIILGQAFQPTAGGQPVALSGRVYCWTDASSGAIEPGDLLTSSSTPGHAMKAADHSRAQGAIIGKAMSRLAEGRGLVLVLVGLQ